MAEQSTADPTEFEGPVVNNTGLDTTTVSHDAIEADLRLIIRDAIACRMETLGITEDMPQKLAWYEGQYAAWQEMNKTLWEDNRAVLTALRRQNDEISATQHSLQALTDENASLKNRIRDLNIELQRPPPLPSPLPVTSSPEYRRLQLAHERLQDAHRTALKDIRQLDFALSRQPPVPLTSSSSTSDQTLVGSSESEEGSSIESDAYGEVPIAASDSDSPPPSADALRLSPEPLVSSAEDIATAIEHARETIFARYRPFYFTGPSQDQDHDMDQEDEDDESRSSTSTMESGEIEDDGYSAAMGMDAEEASERDDGELDTDGLGEQSFTGDPEPEPEPEGNEGAFPCEPLDRALYEQRISELFFEAEGYDKSGYKICRMCCVGIGSKRVKDRTLPNPLYI
ncbi:hypothetical protein DENSPDRAFT_45374 [Dentipellis sp. KUC8613]|nr:hypothetical protein DENSPDRAFT_45374 [Dentipellis sp. KUC8613]